MKYQVFLPIFIFCGVTMATLAMASVPPISPGSYSVKVHFIPPLVSSKCNFTEVWYPAGMPCAMCFCFTGKLSRCFPQPNCDPYVSTTERGPGIEGGVTPPTPQGNIAPSTSISIIQGASEGANEGASTVTSATVVEQASTTSTPIGTGSSSTARVLPGGTTSSLRKSRSPRFSRFDKAF